MYNCNFGIFNPVLNKTKILLYDLDLEIKKGELVAILGETGSGKSCLANAILNYLEFIPKTNNDKETYNIVNGTISYESGLSPNGYSATIRIQ